ncbi:MAG: sterol desaturase/sphingolipid hydroxylase (fatty acid hydroxylase superfamily) [Flavobacterium sp.]|jgi:sterol desaturase/sphingolipid hydroxylase (fatty acid hydroxylase superfamily)
MKILVKYVLHPLILLCVLTAWSFYPDVPILYLIVLLSVQLLLGTLEYWIPARPEWVVHAKEKLVGIVLVLIFLTWGIAVAELYGSFLSDPLGNLRSTLQLDFWPHDWPFLVQLFMAFTLSEFIWYWIHRAEHRWYLVWRISGHGAHHSFKRLNAVNFGLNHPLELFFLAVPPAIVELLFGVGAPAAGAAILVATQASIVHSNLNLSTKGIGLFFTSNKYHIRHHSIILDESNTNYGCATILWDRVFGSFVDSDTTECGVGPTEPSLTEKLIMPIREPKDVSISPS